MKTLFYLLFVGGLIWGFIHYAPSGTTQRALTTVGLANFFENKIPTYLREKLRIPESPIEKRKKLMNQLSQNFTTVEHELEAVVPVSLTGAPVSLAEIPGKEEIRSRIEAARTSLAKSDSVLKELENLSASQSVLQQFTGRVLDKILPPTATSTACIAPQ